MITTIQNKNQSFNLIAKKLPKKRKYVYEMIERFGPISPQDLCEIDFKNFSFTEDYGGYTINEITPRFTELRNAGFIKIVGYKENKRSKHPNAIYRVTTRDEMINIKNKKYQEFTNNKAQLVNDLNLGLSSMSRTIVIRELSKINNQIKNL